MPFLYLLVLISQLHGVSKESLHLVDQLQKSNRATERKFTNIKVCIQLENLFSQMWQTVEQVKFIMTAWQVDFMIAVISQ